MTLPSHHANTSKTLFQNPWGIPEEPDENAASSSSSTLSWLWSLPAYLTSLPIEWAKDITGYTQSITKVVKPDFHKSAADKNTVKATWLGHASFLLELPLQEGSYRPIRVLFDPIFSDRAGPSSWAGIRRRLPPPCSIAELPEFHFILISHNHYDHLDLLCIQEIARTRGSSVLFLVPLGVKSLLVSSGVRGENVHELDWWDEVSLSAGETAYDLDFVCVPAQHTSGKRYGPFDLAMLPIWRGGTLSFISQLGLRLTHHPLLSTLHASPADAVAIHQDVRAHHTLAMHFATFAGSEAEALEPLIELEQSRKEAGIGDWMEEGGIGAIDIGETIRNTAQVPEFNPAFSGDQSGPESEYESLMNASRATDASFPRLPLHQSHYKRQSDSSPARRHQLSRLGHPQRQSCHSRPSLPRIPPCEPPTNHFFNTLFMHTMDIDKFFHRSTADSSVVSATGLLDAFRCISCASCTSLSTVPVMNLIIYDSTFHSLSYLLLI
ncbi:hypothetical protein EW145_g4881 [Phellinidium pouzarii]|uniref:Metallo-beta-lactamase domain-containing protein n=1 Tax=Phellinidium pouzarii TaxID=167371 RepID=A0A4S4L249_9AGAM|nr:hypothetical protein EW145_g4881 [Phellinidium pouzarii]